MNLQTVFNTPKNSYLNQAIQATPKILSKIVLPRKIPKSTTSNPQKSLNHPCYWKSGVQSVPQPPTPHPPPPGLSLFTICPRSTIESTSNQGNV